VLSRLRKNLDSPSTAAQRGSSRRVHSTPYPRGLLARHAPYYAQGRKKGDAEMGLPFGGGAFARFTDGVPGALIPSHLPNTCPWAPGYLEAWLYSYTFTSWGLQYFPIPVAGTMPTCPHPICPCGHKNVAPEALINHVQSSTWAALYFCAACKCVCRSEIALIHVGALRCVSEDIFHG